MAFWHRFLLLGGAVVAHAAACSTKNDALRSSALTPAADVSVEAGPGPSDASAPAIDCVRAAAGQKRDPGFLGGVLGTAYIDLAAFCATFGCPYRNIRDFLNVRDCSPIDAGGYASGDVRSVGCGLDRIGGFGLFGGSEYVFDAKTGTLVGARIGSDTPIGPCTAIMYVAGILKGSCASEAIYDCHAKP